MLVLSVSFKLSGFNLLGLVPVATENKPLFQMGQMYGRLYSFLYRVAKKIIGDMERENNSELVPTEIVQWHGTNLISSKSKPGVKYAVTERTCTCPDYVYRHKECIHIRAFKKSLPACPQPVVNLSERERLDLEAQQAREDLGL